MVHVTPCRIENNLNLSYWLRDVQSPGSKRHPTDTNSYWKTADVKLHLAIPCLAKTERSGQAVWTGQTGWSGPAGLVRLVRPDPPAWTGPAGPASRTGQSGPDQPDWSDQPDGPDRPDRSDRPVQPVWPVRPARLDSLVQRSLAPDEKYSCQSIA
jgi:hypothetical protein